MVSICLSFIPAQYQHNQIQWLTNRICNFSFMLNPLMGKTELLQIFRLNLFLIKSPSWCLIMHALPIYNFVSPETQNYLKLFLIIWTISVHWKKAVTVQSMTSYDDSKLKLKMCPMQRMLNWQTKIANYGFSDARLETVLPISGLRL